MGQTFPRMNRPDGIRKTVMREFGGYEHTVACSDGQIYDMANISGELAPVLSPRRRRNLFKQIEKPNGLYSREHLFWVSGTKLFEDGIERATLSDTPKQFSSLGDRIMILPDKIIYNEKTKEVTSAEATWSGSGKIQDGTYKGEKAAANTIKAPGVKWSDYFKKGDAVTVEGCTNEKNNKTIIIREVEGDELRFYENSFTIKEGGDDEPNLVISRKMPDLDFAFAAENRLWGYKGSTIYASKLGDPTNWNVFDSLASDSYFLEELSAGDFTGACFYMGYPCFFKQSLVFKIYGDKPSNYQLLGSARLGVQPGSGQSLASAGEVLYYLSGAGMVAYTGGIPRSVSAPFGTDQYTDAVAGSDGMSYYVSMRRRDGSYHLFTLSARNGLWYREDGVRAVGFTWFGGCLYMMDAAGGLWIIGNPAFLPEGTTPEGQVESTVEFGDFVDGSPDKKGLTRIQIRAEIDEDSSMRLFVQYDSSGEWLMVDSITSGKKQSYYMSAKLQRCDHYRIKITGKGDWKIYSIARETLPGSGF